ncbi:DNA double-strand break repair nuclease NurA [Mechercharimyces sp. CAU 1602]|uniref:DNA double-strand break repair nuclease NurA n=1 Tax=Mechercharimyces sp. CAU 1602 TaxID=2973933 RepID=UPI0021613F46|nr:DNA double-strand break repair nuclease NurA [Mechercharimyces sp. CAU 1602]MCS1352363.1 DNA double-strand break repair nuclease NurA [Mechercharimyces sp. CAU 1602]
MFPVSENLKHRLREVNLELRHIFDEPEAESSLIRGKLAALGSFFTVRKWSDAELTAWLDGTSIMGVDGSVNSTTGPHPHNLSLFQALAKGTTGEEEWGADVYTPLLAAEEEQEEGGMLAREARKRGAQLSGLELDVAKKAMITYRPKVMMMDGSLLHFQMDDWHKWQEVRKVALEQGVLLIGVSEEIGTRGIAQKLYPKHPGRSDREFLYGRLMMGEGFESKHYTSMGEGMWKVAFRSSLSPQPIGVDGLIEQQAQQQELMDLLYTLTPEQGRGIPLWLDIVDSEVRVTNQLLHAMIEQYIDPALRHRLFLSKRADRVI